MYIYIDKNLIYRWLLSLIENAIVGTLFRQFVEVKKSSEYIEFWLE